MQSFKEVVQIDLFLKCSYFIHSKVDTKYYYILGILDILIVLENMFLMTSGGIQGSYSEVGVGSYELSNKTETYLLQHYSSVSKN